MSKTVLRLHDKTTCIKKTIPILLKTDVVLCDVSTSKWSDSCGDRNLRFQITCTHNHYLWLSCFFLLLINIYGTDFRLYKTKHYVLLSVYQYTHQQPIFIRSVTYQKSKIIQQHYYRKQSKLLLWLMKRHFRPNEKQHLRNICITTTSLFKTILVLAKSVQKKCYIGIVYYESASYISYISRNEAMVWLILQQHSLHLLLLSLYTLGTKRTD